MPENQQPTLAQKLGTTAHLSPLLRKVRRLGLEAPQLRQLAVQRGCRHYETGDEPAEPLADQAQLSNEELAVALLLPGWPYEPHNLRCGAAMLGAPGNDPARLAFMAVRERCEVPLRQIAESGRRFEPDIPFWQQLLAHLPATPAPPTGVLPHPTRYVAMTGLTRRGSELLIEWQRPKPPRL
jgi:hypothetical protein